MFKVPSKSHFLILVLTTVFAGLGCSGPPEKRYIPSADAAQEALTAALEHWKTGAKHGTVETYEIPIEVFDSRWQNGKKLQSYEILKEEQSEGPKIFIVKMKLDEDPEEKEVQYRILGKSPLLIFREQDYQKASGTGG